MFFGTAQAGEGGHAASFLSCEGRIPGSPSSPLIPMAEGVPGYFHGGVLASNMIFTDTTLGMALLPLGNGEAPQSPLGLPWPQPGMEGEEIYHYSWMGVEVQAPCVVSINTGGEGVHHYQPAGVKVWASCLASDTTLVALLGLLSVASWGWKSGLPNWPLLVAVEVGATVFFCGVWWEWSFYCPNVFYLVSPLPGPLAKGNALLWEIVLVCCLFFLSSVLVAISSFFISEPWIYEAKRKPGEYVIPQVQVP